MSTTAGPPAVYILRTYDRGPANECADGCDLGVSHEGGCHDAAGQPLAQTAFATSSLEVAISRALSVVYAAYTAEGSAWLPACDRRLDTLGAVVAAVRGTGHHHHHLPGNVYLGVLHLTENEMRVMGACLDGSPWPDLAGYIAAYNAGWEVSEEEWIRSWS